MSRLQDSDDTWRPATGDDWVEDVEWLIRHGVTDASVIAARTFRTSALTVSRALFRRGRHDLAGALTNLPRKPRRRRAEQVAA